MKANYLLVLAIAVLGHATAFNPVTPFNYCTEKDSSCMSCAMNPNGFKDESCEYCFSGYSAEVPQIPGSRRCKVHPDINPFCLLTQVDNIGNPVPDKCRICQKGKYFNTLTQRCEQYTGAEVADCFNLLGSEQSQACFVCMNGKKPNVPGSYIDRRILTPNFDCSEDSGIENCELVYLDLSDNNSVKCLSCKEDKYMVDGACLGNATGDLKGCHTGSLTKCQVCNSFNDYIMYLPGKCAKKSEVTEEFLIKAREIAAFSTRLIASLISLLILLGLQL